MLAEWTLALMALMICREVPHEHVDVKLAVGQTVLNRADHPAWWGSTPLEVLTKPMQYSTLTDPHDTQLTRWIVTPECWAAAEAVLSRRYPVIVAGADSFYADVIPAPSWATQDRFVRRLGPLKFYNMDRK